MCGITGIFFTSAQTNELISAVDLSVKSIAHRGPDNSETWKCDRAAMGHARLSIIDTSKDSNQPFVDSSGKYVIVFNGEIFNFFEIKLMLESKGVKFKSKGDVEVFLELFKLKKEKAFSEFRGFFSAAIYDISNHEIYLVRDRFGVKPLYYFFDGRSLIFGSEIRAIHTFLKKNSLNFDAISIYFQLNYFGGNETVFKDINKIPAGHFAIVNEKDFQLKKFYSLRDELSSNSMNDKQKSLYELLTSSVKERMIADVPLGCFLSGGIDSTIITGLASGINPNLSSFCLGFKNNPWFDESKYAEIAAKNFNTNHYTFMIDEDEMLSELDNFLNGLDEPFADSSALNFFILSKKTKKHVKAVLSGDGADEIFAGYNKHRAAWILKNSRTHKMISFLSPLANSIFSSSRNSALGNKIRQLEKFRSVTQLGFKEQYWRLASISTEAEVNMLWNYPEKFSRSKDIRNNILKGLNEEQGINSILLKDMELVLEGDMLVKADRMSMLNGLEVRNPFLDHRLVEWAFSLPEEMKTNGKKGKIILRETFKNLIPKELINRKKHGFEIPLHGWMKNQLKEKIDKHYLGKDFIKHQDIFNYEEIEKLKMKLFSYNPGDTPAKAWALLVFNHWYMKNENSFS
ncbi:MAG: asparagine synthase (glutamine-hydrolyzing) [Bacteroidota bacterium]|jgi:asparagine synthase (glutamine-hydrolysing)